MHPRLPRPVESFAKSYPEVWDAFRTLGDCCHATSALDDRARRLTKLALNVGAGLEGGTHSAIRNALDGGLRPEEIRAVAVLAITTIGFPASIRALTWIEDGLSEPSAPPNRAE